MTRELPKGWANSHLIDLVRIRDSERIPVNQKERESRPGSVPYYGATGQVGTIDDALFDDDLLLLGEDGVQFFDPYKPKAYLISGPAWVNNHAHVLEPLHVDRRYLKYFLDQADYHGLATGTTRLKLTQAAMKRLVVPFPPATEQSRIVAELERRLSHVDAADRSTARSRELLLAARRSIHNAVANGSLIGSDAASWAVRTAGDIGEVKGGIQKQPKRKPIENRFPFLRVANVGRGTLDLGDVHEVELFEGELDRFRLERGDLLIVEGNGSVDQIGRAARWDGSFPDCVHQNHLIRMRPGADLLPEFLELVWNSPLVIEQLKAVSSSTSGLHTLSTAKVKSVKLHIPSVGEQCVLVAEAQRRLSIIDMAERALTATAARIEQLRRSLLAAAFSGELVPQDPNDEPADVLLERIRAGRAAAQPKKKTRMKRKEAVS